MLKKTLTLSLLATGLLLTGGAQAATTSGWFINAAAGGASYSATYNGETGTDTGTSSQVNFGWRARMFGGEVGYVNLGSVDDNAGYGNTAHLASDGYTGGVTFRSDFSRDWYVSARGGLLKWTLEASGMYGDPYNGYYTFSGSNSGVGAYLGGGVGLNANEHFSAGLNLDSYAYSSNGVDMGIVTYSISLEYRF